MQIKLNACVITKNDPCPLYVVGWLISSHASAGESYQIKVMQELAEKRRVLNKEAAQPETNVLLLPTSHLKQSK